MSSVQKEGIYDHQRRFEDPEEPFVSQDGRECVGIDVLVEMDSRRGEILNCAVYGTNADESGGNIERDERSFQVLCQESRFLAFVLEIPCESYKGDEDAKLDDQSRLQECAPDALFV